MRCSFVPASEVQLGNEMKPAPVHGLNLQPRVLAASGRV